MRQIVLYPNKILRVKTKEIIEVDKKMLTEIEDLKKLLETSENGAGLAATQIGLDRRFFGVKDTKTKEIHIYFNPKIEKSFGKKDWMKIVDDKNKEEDFLEGCLSFPDFFGTVKRFSKIRVSWDELVDGKLVRKDKDIHGFDAIVWQHESDHLNGIVFVDHVKNDKGKFYKSIGKEMLAWDVDEVLGR